mgnify:CR=1 FL=1
MTWRLISPFGKLQVVAFAVAETTSESVKISPALSTVQPFASVTVTMKSPGGKLVRGLLPVPGWLPQLKEYGDFPPEIWREIAPLSAPQSASVSEVLTVGPGEGRMLTVAVASQPFPSKMVTVKFPTGNFVRGFSPAPGWLPHLNWKTSTPEIGVTNAVPSASPQVVGVVVNVPPVTNGSAEICVGGPTFVQPAASTTVTVKTPSGRPDRILPPPPGWPVQSYEYGGVPPDATTSIEPFWPPQAALVGKVSTSPSGGESSTSKFSRTVQPFASVTVSG